MGVFMNRRLLVAGIAGAAVIGTVVPTLAATTAPVGVTVTPQDGGAYVATSIEGRPLVGGGSTSQGICVGVSEQVPQCVPTTAIQGPGPLPTPPPLGSKTTRQSLPVTVYHDDSRTAVGVKDVGVVIYSNGEVCPVVSTQDWRCVFLP
jgi:hypothetical protein